jgi:hypothetical protein
MKKGCAPPPSAAGQIVDVLVNAGIIKYRYQHKYFPHRLRRRDRLLMF